MLSLVECIQRRYNPETGVNMPFENDSCEGVFRIFFRVGAPDFVSFSSVVFSGRVSFKQLK